MADNFKELLDEQRKTNQLLLQSMEDPSLTSSIKQNLGEILNASRLQKDDQNFTEKTGRIAKTLFKMPKINSIWKNQKRFKI